MLRRIEVWKLHLIFIGIDVSKERLDVAIRPSGERVSVTNDRAGIEVLIQRLREVQPSLIVLEATGGLERGVTRALTSAEFPVVVVNPRQVRDFAKATGQLAKTDRIDALVLARFGEAVRPAIRPLPDEMTLELRALTARRRQLTEMIVAERNRLSAASKAVRKRIEAHIRWLESELDRADKALDQFIRQSPIWQENQDLLKAFPASVRSLVDLFSLSCQNSENSTESRSLPWSALPRLIATVAHSKDVVRSGAVGRAYGRCSIWRLW